MICRAYVLRLINGKVVLYSRQKGEKTGNYLRRCHAENALYVKPKYAYQERLKELRRRYGYIYCNAYRDECIAAPTDLDAETLAAWALHVAIQSEPEPIRSRWTALRELGFE